MVAVLFSLGTHWKRHEVVSEHQLPYLLLFEHVPVFRAIRVVARFSLLAHFALAVLGGIGVYAISRRLPRRWLATPLIGLLATGLVLIEALPKPLATYPIPSDATLQRALQESAPGPTLLVPVSGKDEVRRMWMATEGQRWTNRKRLLGSHLAADPGISGMQPWRWWRANWRGLPLACRPTESA